MSRINEHIFAKEENTPIFESSNSDKIIAYIPKGSWMGIISEKDQRYQIISSKFDGWVSSQYGGVDNLDSKEISIKFDTSGIQYLIPRKGLLAG